MPQQRRINRNRRRARRRRRTFHIVLAVILILFVGAVSIPVRSLLKVCAEVRPEKMAAAQKHNTDSFESRLKNFAGENGLDLSQWPEDLLEHAQKNPELEDFVLNYPLKKASTPEIDLSEYQNSDSVPLLFQWDERWGYSEYAGEMMGLSGCGPTCLSMVSMFLLNDTTYTPRYLAQFSEENGYSVPGSGSSWTLISEGGKKLGLDVVEIPLDKQRIVRNLKVGNPIICVMGPGDFTTTGHFIVLVEYVDGKIRVNDPNSKARSETLWDYDQIEHQIKNLWVCR